MMTLVRVFVAVVVLTAFSFSALAAEVKTAGGSDQSEVAGNSDSISALPAQQPGQLCGEDCQELAPSSGANEPLSALNSINMEGLSAAIAEKARVDLEKVGRQVPQLKANCRLQTGGSSFYGRGDGFAGKRTANGERFNPNLLTAAHRTLPFGTIVEVKNLSNGRTVRVRINDRGPFHKRRILDLSYGAAQQVGMVQAGHAQVELKICQKSRDS